MTLWANNLSIDKILVRAESTGPRFVGIEVFQPLPTQATTTNHVALTDNFHAAVNVVIKPEHRMDQRVAASRSEV